MAPTSVLPTWLADALNALVAGDVDGWLSMFAPDAVHEFPFAPEGRVHRLEGRDEMAAYLGALISDGRLRFGDYEFRVREAGDELIVEAVGHHHRTADDTPVDLDYVWFITRRDGQVTNFRDYMNPLQLAAR